MIVGEAAALLPCLHAPKLDDVASRMLDMLERVEWVKAQAGRHYVCAFCGAVTERNGGPGHQDDCEWLMVTREGNDLRMIGVLR